MSEMKSKRLLLLDGRCEKVRPPSRKAVSESSPAEPLSTMAANWTHRHLSEALSSSLHQSMPLYQGSRRCNTTSHTHNRLATWRMQFRRLPQKANIERKLHWSGNKETCGRPQKAVQRSNQPEHQAARELAGREVTARGFRAKRNTCVHVCGSITAWRVSLPAAPHTPQICNGTSARDHIQQDQNNCRNQSKIQRCHQPWWYLFMRKIKKQTKKQTENRQKKSRLHPCHHLTITRKSFTIIATFTDAIDKNNNVYNTQT